MLPPNPMLTIKFCAGRRLILTFVAAALLSGCGAPGPRALLDGKKLIDKGRYEEAITKLQTATTLLPTNALAWSYLGLACQQAGKAPDAETAYRKALALNPDLNEVHYNRGCLWLSLNRPEDAKVELTAFTLRQANSLDGWLKLGTAQLRLREFSGAERSFTEALRLSNAEPAALTGLGMARVLRGYPRDAVQHFNNALKAHPHYGPALLNLAIVAQEQLKDKNLALQKYREYAALHPPPPNVDAVTNIVRQLEHELAPAAPKPVTPAQAPRAIAETAQLKPAASEPGRPLPAQKQLAASPATNKPAPRPESLTSAEKSRPPAELSAKSPRQNPGQTTGPTADTSVTETVRLSADVVFKPAQDVPIPVQKNAPTQPAPSTAAAEIKALEAKPPKRGFLQKINPLNLFAGDDKSASRTKPVPTQETPAPGTLVATASVPRETGTGAPVVPAFPRYGFKSPPKPAAGNHAEAERSFAEGVQAMQNRRLAEAVQAYRRATQLDPAYFDAQYNLGLAAAQQGDLQMALDAYESALALRPEALDARYNFALLLKQANYPLDAAAELQKILAQYPNDSRSHLALGNLYAQQLRQPGLARKHYQRVLETDPHNSQAGAIRYWLADNPK